MRINKKVALAAGVFVALATTGTALASTITIAPTVGPTVGPTIGTAAITNSFNTIDAFQINSHNTGDSDFVDFANGLNVLYNTVQLGDPHSPGRLGINTVLSVIGL
jgi:uncharacterized membrane protein